MVNHKETHQKGLSKPVFVLLMAIIVIIVVYFANLFLAHLYAKNINNLVNDTNNQITATQDFINEAIDPNHPNAELQNQDVFYARQMAANKEQVTIIQNALAKAQKTPYALGVGKLKNLTVSYFTNLLNYTQQETNLSNYETSLSKINQDLNLLAEVNNNSINGLISKFTNYKTVFDIDLSVSGIDLKVQNNQAKEITTNIVNSLNNINDAMNSENLDKFNTEQANLENFSNILKNLINQNLQAIINADTNSLNTLLTTIQNQYQQIQDSINKINKNFLYIPVAKAWKQANYYLDNSCYLRKCDASQMVVTRTDLVAYPEYLPSYANNYGIDIKNGAYAPGLGYPVLVKINSDDPILYAKTGSFNNWQTLTDEDTVSGGDLNPIDGKTGNKKIGTNNYDILNRATTIVHTNIEPNTTYVYASPTNASSNLYVSSMHFAKNNPDIGVGWYLAVSGDNQPKVFITKDGGKTILMTDIYITSNANYAPKLSSDGSSLYTCWAEFGGAPSSSGCTKWDNFDYLAGKTVGATISPEEYNNFQDGAELKTINKSIAMVPLYVVTTGSVDVEKDQYLHINNRNFKIDTRYSNVAQHAYHGPFMCWQDCYKYYSVSFSQDFIMNGNSLLTQDSGWINTSSSQDIIIDTGSTIDVSNQIYDGPGSAQVTMSCGGPGLCNQVGSAPGGAHGGNGGPGREWNGASWLPIDGSGTPPTDPKPYPLKMPQMIPGGRGGWNDYVGHISYGGGGVIQLNSDANIIISGGSIKSNGGNGNGSGVGGGAGGTIKLDAYSIVNRGSIEAKGGAGWMAIIGSSGQQPGGGGGGGTMAFLGNYNEDQDPNNDTTHVSVMGGEGGGNCGYSGQCYPQQHGGIGWIYYKPKPSYTITLGNFGPSTIGRGASATANVSIIAQNDFSGNISLKGVSRPEDVSYEFIDGSGHTVDHVSLPKNGTVLLTLKVTTNDATAVTDHNILVHGEGTDDATGRNVVKDSSPSLLKISPFVVTGDVYSGGSIIGLNITAGSVATANGVINITGTDYRISNYNTSLQNIQWQVMSRNFENSINQLKQERGTRLNQDIITSNFNLDSNTDNGNGNRTPNMYPDGKVWYHQGPLTIKATQFNGRGTIINIGGDVDIIGNVTYPNTYSSTDKNSLGIIVTDGNNININSNVKSLYGSYYSSGNINVSAPIDGATYHVIMAAKSINFVNAPILTIIYNQTQAQNPPPGFQNLIMPSYSEVSP